MLLEQLIERPDFVAFASGGVWALFTRNCLGLNRSRPVQGWNLLGWFAAFQSLVCWSELGIYGDSGGFVPSFASPLFLIVSLSFLVEFARKSLAASRGIRLGWWLQPSTMAMAVVGWPLGAELDDWIWSTQGILATCLAGIGLCCGHDEEQVQDRRALQLLAAALVGFALVCVATGYFDTHSIATSFYGSDELGSALTLGLPLLVLAWMCTEVIFSRHGVIAANKHSDVISRYRNLARLLTIPLILSLTWISADGVGQAKDQSMRKEVLLRAQLAAGSINEKDYGHLTWTDEDVADPGYQRLKEQMISLVHANEDLKYVLVTGYRGGKSFFLVDSETPDSPNYSPPGDPYYEAQPEYLDGMASRKPFVVGPVKDRWGEWVLASMPLPKPAGAGPGNAEVDIAATDWNKRILAARAGADDFRVVVVVAAVFLLRKEQRSRLDGPADPGKGSG